MCFQIKYSSLHALIHKIICVIVSLVSGTEAHQSHQGLDNSPLARNTKTPPTHPHLLSHLLGALGHDAQQVEDEEEDAGDEEILRGPVRAELPRRAG